jgi:hypothetical protein
MGLNKDKNWWLKNFNFTGICQGWNTQFYEMFKTNFTNQKLNIVIYDRKDKEIIQKSINPDLFQSGWLPYGEDEYHDYDFMMTPDLIVPKGVIIEKLIKIKSSVVLFQVRFNFNRFGKIDIGLVEFW